MSNQENVTVYDGLHYCYLRRDYFRWNEYIEFYKRLGI
jgi:hypothetical protein